MSDTFSTNLAVRLPATGAYNNTWGATLNSDSFNLLDAAIAGSFTFAVGSGTSFSLPAMSPGSSVGTRAMVWNFGGSPSGAMTVTVPGSVPSKIAVAINSTAQTLTFTYGSSASTVTVQPGEYRWIYMDGTNTWALTAGASNSTSLGGTPAANWLRATRTSAEISGATIVQNTLTIPTAIPWATVTEAPTTTIDSNAGNAQQLTLTGNRTMAAPSNARDGSQFLLLVVQDATGGRLLTWNSAFLFENGLAPTLGTAAGAMDLFVCAYVNALSKWVVGHFANLSTGAGTVAPLTIDQNTSDFNLFQQLGSPVSPVNVTLRVATGVVVRASDAGGYAMDLSGLPSGSTINLINLGYIQGRGGDGGRGGAAVGGVSFGFTLIPSNGKSGGTAINGPGSGVTFNITNANGNIWGGGGGGGAGGIQQNIGANNISSGAPGGGGAGGGRGGQNSALSDFNHLTTPVGSDGGNGTNGPSGTFGAAGTGAIVGTAATGVAGAGGTWGTVGTAGTAGSGSGSSLAQGTGGAAGAAVALNGGSVTWASGSSNPNVQGAINP